MIAPPSPRSDLNDGGYTVERPRGPIDLWLDGNEGPGPSGSVLESLAALDPEILRRYPDAGPLRDRLAAQFGLQDDEVVVTAGADEALDRFSRAFLAPNRNLVVLAPAFEMQIRYAELAGAEIREVRWTGGPFPEAEVLRAVDADTCAVAIATPNNPTGLAVDIDVIRGLAARAPGVWLLIDLAYGEFLDQDPTTELLRLPNAIVVRTFSKAAGLAGLRVGYALGPASVIGPLTRAGGPYTVSGPSLALALTHMDQMGGPADTYRTRIRSERRELGALLEAHGARVPNSSANFILAQLPRAQWLWRGLASLGIAVRAFPDRAELVDSLRITCPGESNSFERLVSGVGAVLAPKALLFDMDGVLADVRGSYWHAIVSTAASFGVTVSDEEVRVARAEGDASNDWVVTQRLISKGGRDVELSAVVDRFEERYQGGLWREEVLLLSREVLGALAGRLPLGIVTGRPRRDTERFLDRHGVGEFFSEMVCMEDAQGKPSPEPVRRALRGLGVGPAWMVGDTVDDIRAARGAGVLPLGVLSPGEDPTNDAILLAAGAAQVLPRIDSITELLP